MFRSDLRLCTKIKIEFEIPQKRRKNHELTRNIMKKGLGSVDSCLFVVLFAISLEVIKFSAKTPDRRATRRCGIAYMRFSKGVAAHIRDICDTLAPRILLSAKNGVLCPTIPIAP
jgi:hypothetical protein